MKTHKGVEEIKCESQPLIHRCFKAFVKFKCIETKVINENKEKLHRIAFHNVTHLNSQAPVALSII